MFFFLLRHAPGASPAPRPFLVSGRQKRPYRMSDRIHINAGAAPVNPVEGRDGTQTSSFISHLQLHVCSPAAAVYTTKPVRAQSDYELQHSHFCVVSIDIIILSHFYMNTKREGRIRRNGQLDGMGPRHCRYQRRHFHHRNRCGSPLSEKLAPVLQEPETGSVFLINHLKNTHKRCDGARFRPDIKTLSAF